MNFDRPETSAAPQESDAERERRAAEVYADVNAALQKLKDNLGLLGSDQRSDLKRQIKYIVENRMGGF